MFEVAKTRKRGVHTSKRRSMLEHMQEMVLPSMGLHAFVRWAFLKLKRQTEDAHKVAGGAALGMYINFLPIPGFGGVAAILLALLLRLNVAAAFVGQVPSNPLTFPFIWAVTYPIGALLMPQESMLGLRDLLANFNWAYVLQNWRELGTGVMLKLLVGGQVVGIPLAIATYVLVYHETRKFWAWRRKARQKE